MLRTTADNRRQAPKPARSDSISPRPLETLQDLLESIRCGEPEQVHLLSMLTATAAHISMVLVSSVIQKWMNLNSSRSACDPPCWCWFSVAWCRGSQPA